MGDHILNLIFGPQSESEKTENFLTDLPFCIKIIIKIFGVNEFLSTILQCF
jgi:hypothetical protein